MYHYLAIQSVKESDSYCLTPIREQDIENIRQWRNAQIDILRQKGPISQNDQIFYYQQAIFPTFNEKQPKQILFSFLFEKECIGYGGLTSIDWDAKRAEVSFLVNPSRLHLNKYQSDFTHFLHLLAQVAFDDLHFHRLFTETFAFREDHMQILESCGFKHEGVLRDHVYKRGRWYDSIMHGLLATERPNAR